ncbi:galactose-binding domain-like protein [Entophlyctis helioformis]|nr:galactose-binding domain-like protein [Entophlyctis helioformis]
MDDIVQKQTLQGAAQEPDLLPLDAYASYVDLASESYGGKILFATDDFFAVAENMLKRSAPVWNDTTYTEYGKEMDGWETRRKRSVGHDWCIIELGLPGTITGIHADTAYFTGNNVPAISIQSAVLSSTPDLPRRNSQMGSAASPADCAAVASLKSEAWHTILPRTRLRPGRPETRHHVLAVSAVGPATHIRLNIYPDGGLARLRIHGLVTPPPLAPAPAPTPTPASLPQQPTPAPAPAAHIVDVVSVVQGGRPLSWSNAHYGSPIALLAPQRSTGMHDGWETARYAYRPHIYTANESGQVIMGHDEWVVIACRESVFAPGSRIVIDTNHYKGNYPESVVVEVSMNETVWRTVVERTKLGPHAEQAMSISGDTGEPFNRVRVTMIPDGGISRLRVYAAPVETAGWSPASP